MPAVYLHHLPQLLRQLGLQADIATPTLQHCAASAVTLLLPGALAAGVHWASPVVDLGLQALGARETLLPLKQVVHKQASPAVCYAISLPYTVC